MDELKTENYLFDYFKTKSVLLVGKDCDIYRIYCLSSKTKAIRIDLKQSNYNGKLPVMYQDGISKIYFKKKYSVIDAYFKLKDCKYDCEKGIIQPNKDILDFARMYLDTQF